MERTSRHAATGKLFAGSFVGIATETAVGADAFVANVAHANGILETLFKMTALGSAWVLYLTIFLNVVSLGSYSNASFFLSANNGS